MSNDNNTIQACLAEFARRPLGDHADEYGIKLSWEAPLYEIWDRWQQTTELELQGLHTLPADVGEAMACIAQYVPEDDVGMLTQLQDLLAAPYTLTRVQWVAHGDTPVCITMHTLHEDNVSTLTVTASPIGGRTFPMGLPVPTDSPLAHSIAQLLLGGRPRVTT